MKVEGTSFTVSEPFSKLDIEPIIYTYASPEQKRILKEQFGVEPFLIHTIRLERIFADKIFAAEFYYNRGMYFDVAKHVYDVSVMMDILKIQEMMKDNVMFLKMLGYKRLEEKGRIGSDLADRKFADFKIFGGLLKTDGLKSAYDTMQRNYVFNPEDILKLEVVQSKWDDLEKILKSLDKDARSKEKEQPK